MKRHYFKIKKIFHKGSENYVEQDKFKTEYLDHSFRKAKERFGEVLTFIKSGRLQENNEHFACLEIPIKTQLILVIVEEGLEKELITRTSDEPQMNKALEEAVLERDHMRTLRELKIGHLRHLDYIENQWYFQVETIEKMPGKNDEKEIENIRISHYGSMVETLDKMSRLRYSEKLRISGYDPELGESLTVRKFLVERKDHKETKILLVENKNTYPLSKALVKELDDKYYFERLASKHPRKKPFFGREEVIYNIIPTYLTKQRNLKDPKVTFGVLVFLSKINDPEFSDMVSQIYEEGGGEDLFEKEREAYKFYHSLHMDQINKHTPSEFLTARGFDDFFIQNLNFIYRLGKDSISYPLYKPNTLIHNPIYSLRLQEIKEKRRSDLIKLNPMTEAQYEIIEDSLQNLKSLNSHYVVYKGHWTKPEKERRFFHHNLHKSREAALDFFRQAKDAEFESTSAKPISLILSSSELRDDPLFIASTYPNNQEFIQIGRQQERKIYTQLGFRLDELDSE